MSSPVGIIAGRGRLPFLSASNYRDKGIDCYIAALEGECDLELITDFHHQVFKIGMVGSAIEYFQQHNIKDIIFVGGVNRPNLRSIKVDALGAALIARIIKQKFLGDDKLLRIIAKFFEEKGFKIVAYNHDLEDTTMSIAKLGAEVLTNTKPTQADLDDITLGIRVLNTLSPMDIGQSVVVEDGYVLGIEAAEGTDNLIERCALLRKNSASGVLVKMMKLGQDSRFDMPTVGPTTINKLAYYNYKGIAIQKNAVIILEQELTLALANEYKLFIVR